MTKPSATASSWAFALLRITRAENCVMALFCTLLGVHLASNGALWDSRVVAAAAAVSLTLAFGNVVNDIFDIDVDRVAKPNRPIPSGSITAQQAQWLSMALAVAATALSASLGPWYLVFAVTMLGIAVLYSWRLKRTALLGNVTVAFQSSCVVLFGAAVAREHGATAWMAALVVFMGMLIFEVVKDLEDQTGDAQAGIHTVAHALGHSGQRRLLLVLLAVSALVVAGIGIAQSAPQLYWVTLLPLVPLGLLAVRMPVPARYYLYIYTSKFLWLISLIGLWTLR